MPSVRWKEPDLPESYLPGLSALESRYYEDRSRSPHNPFGLTHKVGNNVNLSAQYMTHCVGGITDLHYLLAGRTTGDGGGQYGHGNRSQRSLHLLRNFLVGFR